MPPLQAAQINLAVFIIIMVEINDPPTQKVTRKNKTNESHDCDDLNPRKVGCFATILCGAADTKLFISLSMSSGIILMNGASMLNHACPGVEEMKLFSWCVAEITTFFFIAH